MINSELPLSRSAATPLPSARLAVEVRKASVIYQATDSPVHALSDIDLDIREGEFVALIGPSGCGKTTLMRVIADLEKISAGQVL
ncbi:MAG: ATP-binding cassette domain-containing protein, partial [Polaromonas sp.]